MPESFITYITRAIGTRVAVAVGVITILGYIIAFGGICIFVGSYIVQNVFGNSHIWGLTQLTTIVYGVLVVAPVVAGLRWPPTPTRSAPRRRPSSRSSRRSSPGSSCPA